MDVQTLTRTLQTLAPLSFAESWDNVGLIIGDRRWPVAGVLLTIDLTETVLDEAVQSGANMIVAYHPPIFRPLAALTDGPATQRLPLRAARAGMAVYSPHTALDAAPEGVNDWLAGGLGSGDVRALQPLEALSPTQQCKIVTFCPSEVTDLLRQGMASVGAGRIGDYEQCSFELQGRGTFLGGESTQPSVGSAGELERVEEVRLEMVCPADALALLVMTIRHLHPYEEPPIEVYPLRAQPQRGTGQGRRVVLDQPATLEQLVERLKRHLGVGQVRVAPGRDAPRAYQTVGLCAGAGGSLLDTAIEQGCEVFLTGEMRHHDVLAAQGSGCTVVLAGHTNTERGYLPTLKQRILEAHPELTVGIAQRDGDPLVVM